MGVADFRMHFEGPMISPRWQALVYMIDARVREFIREPHAIFWVYGFPIILAISLGFAFREAAPAFGVITTGLSGMPTPS